MAVFAVKQTQQPSFPSRSRGSRTKLREGDTVTHTLRQRQRQQTETETTDNMSLEVVERFTPGPDSLRDITCFRVGQLVVNSLWSRWGGVGTILSS